MRGLGCAAVSLLELIGYYLLVKNALKAAKKLRQVVV
jgi:hypothetical protein